MAQIFNIISIVSFSLAGVFLIIAVILWIKFNIPKIIGDLTGRTAKKSIAQMRKENEKTGKKSYTPKSSDEGGSIKLKSLGEEKTASLPTEKLGNVNKPSPFEENRDLETSLLNENNETELLEESSQTELLSESPETELLGQTDILEEPETELLGMTDSSGTLKTDTMEETTLLDDGTTLLNEGTDGFRVIQSIVYIHTQEVI